MDDEKLRMYVGYSTKVDTKFLGVWSIPHRRCMHSLVVTVLHGPDWWSRHGKT